MSSPPGRRMLAGEKVPALTFRCDFLLYMSRDERYSSYWIGTDKP
jgi:hypothetical protein